MSSQCGGGAGRTSLFTAACVQVPASQHCSCLRLPADPVPPSAAPNQPPLGAAVETMGSNLLVNPAPTGYDLGGCWALAFGRHLLLASGLPTWPLAPPSRKRPAYLAASLARPASCCCAPAPVLHHVGYPIQPWDCCRLCRTTFGCTWWRLHWEDNSVSVGWAGVSGDVGLLPSATPVAEPTNQPCALRRCVTLLESRPAALALAPSTVACLQVLGTNPSINSTDQLTN